ncbi:MAG: sugar phosphate isomerase/epimerase [Oscillospiraceae bacterium]|nr:sugar phosphate isomerase/epimerase [Oscillospiraceae bacterium]
MKLGVLTVPLYGRPLADALTYLSDLGVQAVELGTGGYPGKGHVDPNDYIDYPEKVAQLQKMLADNHIVISALSCHGNPVHPVAEEAARYRADYEKTLKLAQMLGVDTVVTFSGCPGGDPAAKSLSWVTCAWPNEYADTLKYQWDEVLIPYWKEAATQAKAHGVTHIALEMHPGFCVYNPATLMRLRDAVGDVIGANYDPSHMLWQGISPAESVKYLAGAIYHVHAKDTYLDPSNIARFGVLDTKAYGDMLNRSWTFRTVGYGSDPKMWKDFISALKMTGYDGAVSIEHEDPLMSVTEGLEKAIAFLKDVLVFENPEGGMWWI